MNQFFRHFILVVLVFSLKTASAQQHATNVPPLAPPFIDQNTPAWALEMYSEKPNVNRVDQLYREYINTHPSEKTIDTRNYKHWRAYLYRYDMVQPDGSIVVPTFEEQEAATADWMHRKAAFDAQNSDIERSPTSNWTQIGPYENTGTGSTYTNVQSCQVALTQCLGDLNVLYSVSQNGKVFKTTDHGDSWNPVGENYSFSGDTWTEQCITAHPSDPNTVYYGTGNKLWKTTDGGTTWNTLTTIAGLEPNCIIINPNTPNTLFVSSDLGIYKSTDAGATFSQVRAGKAWDLRFNTADPSTIFALCQNGAKTDFYKSTDNGATWPPSITGWFSDPQDSDGGGRMTVSTGNPNLIYCFIIGHVIGNSATKPIVGVAKSTDAGATWTKPVTWDVPKGINSGQGYYDLDIEVSDADDNLVLIGTQSTWKTTDGFATVVSPPSGQHADPQEYHFNGPNDFWVASDGGVDLYNSTLTSRSPKSKGITGTEFWGFDQGWNEDTRVGSYYHNGTSGYRPTYPNNQFRALGGGEPATGYISVGDPAKVWFNEVGGKYLPSSITGTVTSFTYAKFPNESYWGQDVRGEIAIHPLYYNTHFLGKDNVLWKTTDGGVSFTAQYTFGSNPLSLVTSIEISRSNPQIMYVYQLIESNASYTSGKLWKTTDGGATFTEIVQPSGAPASDGCFIGVDPLNPDNIWIAYNKTNTSNKVFKTTNGGSTWTNLTTNVLSGLIPRALVHIGGTDGGVYLMTPHMVFYRNNSLSDWQAFGNSLPAKLENNYLRPFYKEGKMRMATVCRGMWSVDFYENPTTPIAQPTVDKITSECYRDTFYFDDYSMLNHTNATWQWTFDPAPQYVSSTTVRNPKVILGAAGNYSATLTVTDGNGVSNSKTVANMVSLGASDICGLTGGPEMTLSTSTTVNYARTMTAIPLGNTNTITISAWVKPTGTQVTNAGIVFSANGGATGMNFRANNQLGYHWADGASTYNWSGGPTVPADVWSHVVLVIEPTKATMYLNGVPYTNSVSHAAVDFTGVFNFGNDRNNSSRTMTGEIDEVRFYNRALSQNEIRELRHLTYAGGDNTCKAYYKFNESSGVVYDRIGLAHGALLGTATRVERTGPFAPGESNRQSVSGSGVVDFSPTNLQMTFPGSGTYPGGELVASRLDGAPYNPPAGFHTIGSRYWVVNNHGSNTSFSSLTEIKFSNLPITSSVASEYQLYKRSSNDHLNTWVLVDNADAVVTGTSGSVTFNSGLSLTSFSQLMVARSTSLPLELLTFEAGIVNETDVRLRWTTANEMNVDYFEVEKSENSAVWKAIGQVKATGGPAYNTLDRDAFGAVSPLYYRIKMVDNNGEFSYSPTRTVQKKGLAVEPVLAPNPAVDFCKLTLDAPDEGSVEIRIFNAEGKLLQYQKSEHSKGANTFNLDLRQLPAGTYLVQITLDNRAIWNKWVEVSSGN